MSTNNGTTWTKIMSNIGPQQIILSGSKIFVLSARVVYLSENNGNSWSTLLTTRNFPVNSLVINGNELYAGMYNGVLHSTDNGATWSGANNGLNNIYMSTVFANDSVVLGSNYIGNLFYSSDAGTTWLPSMVGSRTVVAKTRPVGLGPYLLLASANGDSIMRSSDYGKSWSATGLYLGYGAALLAYGNDFYAMSYDSLFHSSDHGISWTTVSGKKFLESLAANDTYLFAGHDGDGIYISSDKGQNWTASSLNTNDTIDMDIQKRVKEVQVIGTHVFARDYYGKLFMSHDNGTTWFLYKPLDIHFISLETNGSKLYAATNKGVMLSTDYGVTWTKINTGIATENITGIAVNTTHAYAGTKGYGVWKRPVSEFSSVGIMEKEAKQLHLMVYPNPSDGKFQIDLTAGTNSQISLLNLLGEKVYTTSGDGSRIAIDASDLQKGYYVLQVKTNVEVQNAGIVIR